MKPKMTRFAALSAAILSAAFLHGCGYRAEAAPLAADAPVAAESSSPAPTAAPEFTVEYRYGDEVLASESVPLGGVSSAGISLPDGLRLAAWTDAAGERVDPAAEPVNADTVYYALARPVLREDAAFLFPDEYGLLRPESEMTHAECAAALLALAPREHLDAALLAALETAPDDALTRDELRQVLDSLFDPDAVELVFSSLPETENAYATRAEAAFCVSRLLGRESAAEDIYYPDVAPTHWAAADYYTKCNTPQKGVRGDEKIETTRLNLCKM